MNVVTKKTIYALGIIVVMVVSAWFGVESANRWVLADREHNAEQFPAGTAIRLHSATGGEVVYAGADAKEFRDFIFSQRAGLSLEPFLTAGRVVSISPATRLEVLRQDLELLEVKVLGKNGVPSGQILWVEVTACEPEN